jgi:excisionase family DNA binding protein
MPVKIGEDLVLYTVEELSELFDVQAKTIRRMLRDGEIKGRKLARRWYTTEQELRDYFLQTEAEAPQEGE